MPKGYKKDGSYAGKVFQKGELGYWFGKKRPDMTEVWVKFNKKYRPHLGHKHSLETKKIIGEKAKGKIPWNKEKKGYHTKGLTEETKRKMSEARQGKKNPSWQGGKSFEPYGLEFNNQLRELIRKRDNHRCQECFRHQSELRTKTNRLYKLTIHHIDYNKRNNDIQNLISLCRNCHLQTNFRRPDWLNYFKEKVHYD